MEEEEEATEVKMEALIDLKLSFVCVMAAWTVGTSRWVDCCAVKAIRAGASALTAVKIDAFPSL
jgi:hypothetical protein